MDEMKQTCSRSYNKEDDKDGNNGGIYHELRNLLNNDPALSLSNSASASTSSSSTMMISDFYHKNKLLLNTKKKLLLNSQLSENRITSPDEDDRDDHVDHDDNENEPSVYSYTNMCFHYSGTNDNTTASNVNDKTVVDSFGSSTFTSVENTNPCLTTRTATSAKATTTASGFITKTRQAVFDTSNDILSFLIGLDKDYSKKEKQELENLPPNGRKKVEDIAAKIPIIIFDRNSIERNNQLRKEGAMKELSNYKDNHSNYFQNHQQKQYRRNDASSSNDTNADNALTTITRFDNADNALMGNRSIRGKDHVVNIGHSNDYQRHKEQARQLQREKSLYWQQKSTLKKTAFLKNCHSSQEIGNGHKARRTASSVQRDIVRSDSNLFGSTGRRHFRNNSMMMASSSSFCSSGSRRSSKTSQRMNNGTHKKNRTINVMRKSLLKGKQIYI